MRVALAVILLVAACKKHEREPTPDPPIPQSDCTIEPAPQGAIDGGAVALLARCRPCGNWPWEALIKSGNFDPDAPPDHLPSGDEIFKVLDACQHTCASSARSQIADELRPSEYSRAAAAPWKDLAKLCPGALALDDHTRRFARGTWYALGEVAHALPAGAAIELPLPPFTAASTAVELPRSDSLAPWHPRVQVTVGDPALFAGVLPWVLVAAQQPLSLVPGPGLDYPGDSVDLTGLAAKLSQIDAALASSTHDADKETDPVLVAPRGLALTRLVEVAGKMPGRAWLTATPASQIASAWPDPLGVIACSFAPGAPLAGTASIDLSRPGPPIPTQIASAPLPDGATAVHVTLPATAQVDALAAALTALAQRKVTTAFVSLSP